MRSLKRLSNERSGNEFSGHSSLIIDVISSQTEDVYFFVCLSVHLLAESGHHGDLLQGLLND